MRIPLPPVPLPETVVDVAREYADGTRIAADFGAFGSVAINFD